MTTLVTGGSGYLGGALVRALMDKGERVRVLARPSSDTATLDAMGVPIAHGDILDQTTVEAALDGCETLYHAAATYAYWSPDKRAIVRTAVEGTRSVLQAALNRNVKKVIYTSSTMALGGRKGEVVNEQTVHCGQHTGTYARAKAEAEQVARQFSQQGLPIVTVNPSGIYGPGWTKVVGKTLLDAVHGKLPMIFSAPVAFVYLDDAVRGHLLAAERGVPGERYILSGSQIAVADVAASVMRLTGTRQPPTRPLALGMAIAFVSELVSGATKRPPLIEWDSMLTLSHGMVIDGSRAERELGLTYTAFEEGIRATVIWWWEHGYLPKKPPFLS